MSVIFPPVITGEALPSVVLTDTAQNNVATTTHTYSARNLGTAGRRHIGIAVGWSSAGATTGCTVAGISATLINQTVILTTLRSALYIASVPTGTTGTIVVTLASAGGAYIGVYALYNLRSATPVATATAAVNGAVPTYTLNLNANVAARGVVVGTFTGAGVTSITPIGLNNQTVIRSVGGAVTYSADYTATAAETPRTMGWTVNQDTAGCLATFR